MAKIWILVPFKYLAPHVPVGSQATVEFQVSREHSAVTDPRPHHLATQVNSFSSPLPPLPSLVWPLSAVERSVLHPGLRWPELTGPRYRQVPAGCPEKEGFLEEEDTVDRWGLVLWPRVPGLGAWHWFNLAEKVEAKDRSHQGTRAWTVG
jgi:hypothetical protein